MSDIVCLSVDAESESGARLAKKYGVRGYPALLFLNSDGSPRDAIAGYMPTDPFHEEVKRIKSGEGTITAFRETIAKDAMNLRARFGLIEKLTSFNAKEDIAAVRSEVERLVAAGHGYDAKDSDSVYGLYKDLKSAGMTELAEDQVAVMRALDPDGTSLGMRKITFDGIMKDVRGPSDLDPVMAFLANETHDEILFDGWYAVYSVNDRAAKQTRKRDEHKILRLAAREAALSLWKHTPEKYQGSLGNAIAWGFYEDEDDLTDSDKAFAVEVAKIAAAASEDDVNVIDTYACCLFISGKAEEAVKQIDRCIELDPENKQWLERRDEFTKGNS